MIIRAYKHILQAVVAAADNFGDLAAFVAACLNILLGTASVEDADKDLINDDALKWKWVETFLLKRFGWQWKNESFQDMRKYAILRGLSHKVCMIRSFCYSLKHLYAICTIPYPPVSQ